MPSAVFCHPRHTAHKRPQQHIAFGAATAPAEAAADPGGGGAAFCQCRLSSVNFQVTILKVLTSYQDGFASLADIKRDVSILATSGPEWSDRTKKMGARLPGLEIFSQGLVERRDGGWRITDAGRSALDLMESKPADSEADQAQKMPSEPSRAIVLSETSLAAPANSRRLQRPRRDAGRRWRTANASR